MKRLTSSLLAITALFTSTSLATADEYSRIVGEAIAIQEKSDILLDETHHYQRTPGYRDLVRCVLEQNRLASRVQALAVREANIVILDRELDRLDRMFHRVENLFDTIEEEAARGCGHVVGNTRHVKKLLNHIERCIHKMQRDVKRIRNRDTCVHTSSRPVYVEPIRPVYGNSLYHSSRPSYRPYGGHGNGYGQNYAHGGRGNHRAPGGLTFGNDRFSFSIGF